MTRAEALLALSIPIVKQHGQLYCPHCWGVLKGRGPYDHCPLCEVTEARRVLRETEEDDNAG